MADSIEQKIIAHAVTSLQAINGTGDYLMALGTTLDEDGESVPSVADSRPNWEQAEQPAISVFTGQVESEEQNDEGLAMLRKLPIAFMAFLERSTTASDARKLLSDIHRVIRGIGDEWTVSETDLAQYTSERGHVVITDETTYEITGVQVEIDVYYRASKFNMEA